MINIVVGEKPNGSGGCLHHTHTNGFTTGPPCRKHNGSVFQRCQHSAAISDAESSAQQPEHGETDLQQRGYDVWIFNKAVSSTLYVGQLQGENDLQNTFTRNVTPPPHLIPLKNKNKNKNKTPDQTNQADKSGKERLLTKRQSGKFPLRNIRQHSASVYAVFFIHLFRLRWISLLKINKYRSKQTQESQLLHFCPADLNSRHLFSYNPSHRKFIYTDRDFWNFAGLVIYSILSAWVLASKLPCPDIQCLE